MQGEDIVKQWLALFPKPAVDDGFGGIGDIMLPDCDVADMSMA